MASEAESHVRRLASDAASASVESRDIMAQTGHKSETVMRGYGQDVGLGATAAVKAAFRE